MRIVLDANILVRANTRSQGPARELLDVIRSNSAHVLILSRQILEEVGRTLLYPRLQAQYRLSKQDIQEHVDLLQRVSTVVEPVVGDPLYGTTPRMTQWFIQQFRAAPMCYAPVIRISTRRRSLHFAVSAASK
jgi:putative PIN family toxin of toxin-antitoxin system